MIDLVADPERAARDRIIAVPARVRRHPTWEKQVVGDLSSTGTVLAALGLGGGT